MNIRWIEILSIGIIGFFVPIAQTFAQEEPNESAIRLAEEILPNYHYEFIPDFTYEQVADRIKNMETGMPFELNDRVFSFIQYFTVRNREYTKMVLARKDRFFPLFEETLKRHEMPTEIEFLSIIESGLDPKIKSRVGAMGLWQFMPATGRMYGMQVNQDIDDRMDPDLSTEAAAKYLKALFRMFDDWEVALAAYNCGPGNVRKAIKRSGGKKTFWGIYNHLPKETRGYVPQFQAMLYILNHLEEHNFNLEEPTYPVEYEQIRFDRAFSLDRLAALSELCLKDLEELNPSIKKQVVPASHQSMSIRIPKSKSIYLKENISWISDSLGTSGSIPMLTVALMTDGKTEKKELTTTKGTVYKVKPGDALGVIASKHGVSVNELREWNNLSSNLIKVGQELTIHPEKVKQSGEVTSGSLAENSRGINSKTYTVKPGDSLWIISQKHSLTIEQIKRLNNLNSNTIKPGQTLIIG